VVVDALWFPACTPCAELPVLDQTSRHRSTAAAALLCSGVHGVLSAMLGMDMRSSACARPRGEATHGGMPQATTIIEQLC
jgi:hypothetical protein